MMAVRISIRAMGTGVLLGVTLLLTVLLGVTAAAAQFTELEPEIAVPVGPCGSQEMTIARLQWPSAAILAHIHALILEQEFGCEVRVIDGDLVGSTSSMATTGQPAIMPELWVNRIAQIWNSTLESERLRPAAATFFGGELEGWFASEIFVEQFPNVRQAEQLLGAARQLSSAGERLMFVTCPADWACSVINQNLLRAYGLENLVEIIVPGNRFEMDFLIGQSISRGRPVVFYYWQPNSALAQFSFTQFEMGRFDADAFKCLGTRACPNPQPTPFVIEDVFVVMASWVSEEAPDISNYFLRASMPISDMNQMMAWQAGADLSFEQIAARFVREREELWRSWIVSR